jgi:NitT/TauT family transport system substrate-binding protein
MIFLFTAASPRPITERRIFRDQGINVTLDESGGSVESVTRVATGTHPLGLADLSTLVEFSAQSEEAPTLIMTVFDRQQLAA